MVLLVPDDSDALEATEKPKAQLDDSEAGKATQKVDLDLDDAPFLEDEDEEEEDVVFEEEETPLLAEEEKKGFDLKALFKNKLVIIFIGIILLLIGVIGFLIMREPETLPPPPPQQEQEIVEEAVPAEPIVEEIPETLIRLEPFLIEQRDKENTIRFLEVRIVISTPDEGLAKQFKQETFTVRNALYYYMKNKDLQFLSDKENSDKLKKELLAIINQYMGFGQFETLLFEQYLVR
ncbi:Flagellar basal body-associated protein FliL [Pseudodesulfovibrio profundus]|uniref:Flagellar protein FliL n=1 Tax=Pseudodesulfovibrio profundus TaxID=57320 RepID=A0A2C8F3Y8_9BACT|nr:flagellar basal body-associated FliL family protein [Pseudodesulfovibrio profundus]SOB57082.1 Flagellar basal body-associated protein FliL [Pseudodesulfovibrio profundus]|tara:strand:+ start:274 stop:978 length:705 start_codon:yes stop_codon:yes gene_type:complete